MKTTSLMAAALAAVGLGSLPLREVRGTTNRKISRRPTGAWRLRKISLKDGQYALSPTTSRAGTVPGRRHHRRMAVREEGWKVVKNAAKAIREVA